MNFHRPRKRGFAGFDMTPMIDVVLQLIIFFMYTSQFAQLARTPIDMPKEIGDQDQLGTPSTITIDVTAEGVMLIEREAVSIDDIERLAIVEIERAGGDASHVGVLIRADARASTGSVNAIGNRLSELGLRGWQLGTNVPTGARP